SLGASQTAIGLLFGSYAIALFLFTPIFGIVSDRVGRRGPMLGGLIGLAGATLLYVFANSLTLLVVARVLQGISAAATWTAGLALLADLFPTEMRGRAMGMAMAGMAVGMLVGPLFGGVLYELGGYSLPFFVAAGFAVLDGLARMFLLKDAPHSPVQK